MRMVFIYRKERLMWDVGHFDSDRFLLLVPFEMEPGTIVRMVDIHGKPARFNVDCAEDALDGARASRPSLREDHGHLMVISSKRPEKEYEHLIAHKLSRIAFLPDKDWVCTPDEELVRMRQQKN